MSGLNINDLPPEILIKVFRFLDVANRTRATLTCKLWNNLIESACRWSLDLHDDQDGAEQKMDFILTTNRKFKTISVGRLEKDDQMGNQIRKIFQRHGFSVLTLSFYKCDIAVVTLTELLHSTPNLKCATITGINLRGALPLDQNLPELKYLKNLTILASEGQRCIECFQKAKLTTIRIIADSEWENCGQLVDFLSSQKMLTSLTAESISSRSILVEMAKSNVSIPFQLTKLSIDEFVYQASLQHHDNTLKFVKSQAENLTELNLGFNVSASVFESVLSMAKLNTLTVKIDFMPQDNAFNHRLTENCSVRTLTLQDNWMFESENIQSIVEFLKKLPNVRRLILACAVKKIPSIMMQAQSLNKLESLRIVRCCAIGSAKFPNLKTLLIQNLSGEIDWNEFTKAHPLLTDLTIVKMDKESYLTSDDIDQMTTNVDLQSIRLGVGFVADDRFFEIIRSKCTKLKMLELHKSTMANGPNYNVGINVLRLCDDIKFIENVG